MNNAPHLSPEDRPEFERALDEALRTAARRPALAGLDERLTAEQLRVMALSAATAIAACAAVEYEHFTGLRSELRGPRSAPSSGAGQEERAESGEGREGGGLTLAGAGAMGEGISETAGVGFLAMVSVLVPMLAGTAAVIFLVLGYLLHVMTPEPSIAAPMRGAGWVFAVLAAAGIVVGMAELWLTALRNGAGARRRAAHASLAGDGGDGPSLAEEVAAARAVWREALLERGIVPFLREALGGPDPAVSATGTHAPVSYAPAPRPATGADEPDKSDGPGAGPHDPSQEQRTPRFGYSGPDFSSRTPSDGRGERSVRPRYSSPDYSSPDYGGPEHPPE